MEIGSVLELEESELYLNSDNKISAIPLLHENAYNTIFYQSGRNAIESLFRFLSSKGVRRVLMPDYICSVVPEAIMRANVEVVTYEINSVLGINIDDLESKLQSDVNVLYIVHLFGKPFTNEEMTIFKQASKKGVLLVEDLTMSLLSTSKEVGFGDYVVGSIRKWLPIPDGGFVASKKELKFDEQMPINISKYTNYYFITQLLKRDYIKNGEINQALKDTYMSFYHKSTENNFSDYTIYPMSELSLNYIKNVDGEDVYKKRKQNYDYLYEGLKSFKHIELLPPRKEGYISFGMFVQSENKERLLSHMIKNKIYCNTHWNISDNRIAGFQAKIVSKKAITIPCDQRYGILDMDRIIKVMGEFESDSF